jgi:hypothetical protein
MKLECVLGLAWFGCRVARWFQTKNPNVGRFWRALEWKMMAYLMDIWDILWPFGKCCDNLVYFLPFWYIVSRKKSGNPAWLCLVLGL